jgi:hypothetical protein
MLYEFRVDAAPQKQGSARVSEIVPTNGGEISTSQQGFEVAVHNVLSI